jgi:hypothetical protein
MSLLVLFLGFLGVLALAGGVVLGLFAWNNLRVASLLGRPLSRIGKLRPGLRRVRGKVVPFGEVLRSPVTKKGCVYYRLQIYEERKHWKPEASAAGTVAAGLAGGATGILVYRAFTSPEGESRASHSWHHIAGESMSVPLLIEDDTGTVEVDLEGATIISTEKSRIATDVFHPPSSALCDLLNDQFGIDPMDRRGSFKALHFVEELLLVGAKVTVVGNVAAVEKGALCFLRDGGELLVSERDVGKQGRAARTRALGLTAGAGGVLALALVLLCAAFVLLIGDILGHR